MIPGELQTLDVRNSSLVGLLPEELSALHKNLEEVLLSNNGLSGPLPQSWAALSGLRILDLGKKEEQQVDVVAFDESKRSINSFSSTS